MDAIKAVFSRVKGYALTLKAMASHADFWAGVALGTGFVVGFALGRL